MRGRVLSGLPSYSVASGAGAHRALVMDVPVIIQLTFLQYFENVEVPQIPSSTECYRFQLYYRVVYVQCKLCKKPEMPQRSSWSGCSRARCSAATVAWGWTVPKTVEVPQLQLVQSLEIIDTPVVLDDRCLCWSRQCRKP